MKYLMGLGLGMLLATLAPGASSYAGDVTIDKTHTQIVFSISHFGFSDTYGTFKEFDGTISINDETPETSTVDFTIQTASIDTYYAKRDEHLRGKDFFDVQKFPTMRFVSTKVERTGDKTAKLHGDFTMKGVTKPITLDVTLRKQGMHPIVKRESYGFTATGTIDRTDFGFDTYAPAIGADVSFTIETELNTK